MPTETNRLVVGRIVKPHGIRGEVVVELLTDAPDRFDRGRLVWVGDPEGAPVPRTIASSRPHQDHMIVRFGDVEDRTAAERLRGALLSIPVSEARRPEPGRYYPHELEGFEVVDEAGTVLGNLADVVENPANDLWVVRAGTKDVLVPAVKEIVLAVDVGRRRIVLRPVQGLFEE